MDVDAEATSAARVGWLRRALPTGRSLPGHAWDRRHRAMVWLLFLHAVGVTVFGIAMGYGVAHSVVEAGAVLTALGLGGAHPALGRKVRSGCVTLGLLSASAFTVHFSGGVIEAHFHFFVMIAVLSLYEDWFPFLLAAAYVVFHHGVTGVLDPAAVYNHGDAESQPWKWAAIHAAFVTVAGAVNVLAWRLNEEIRSETRRLYDRARENEKRFRHAFEEAPIGMALVSVESERPGRFLRVNRALCEMTGYGEHALLQRGFQDITHRQDLADGLVGIRRFIDGTADHFDAEKRYVHADGRDIRVQVRSSLVRDEDGQPSYAITQITDVTARHAAEAELAHRALHDSLTGLPNRALFHDRLRYAVARLGRTNGFLAVMFLDVDDFKTINDTLGHDAGDAVLRAYAERLPAVLRDGDTVARFGGDEFTILCNQLETDQDLERVADRVMAALSVPVLVGEDELFLTASLGVARATSPSADPDALIADADAAMYRAKSTGPGRRAVFDDGIRTEAAQRLEVENALRRVVEADELRLHYQPIIELATGTWRSLEALLRWERPGRGLVPPGDFIPVAERSGMIVPIGEWTLRQACADARSWQDAAAHGDALALSVNLSPRQLCDPGLVDKVAAALDASGLDPQLLCLEITEAAITQEDDDVAFQTLSRLRAIGVKLAIDDFGSGFSSLGRLRGLPPVDVLKVDRSLVQGSHREERARAMLAAAVSMGQALELTVVAEGVETEAEAAALRRLGCHAVQGFLYARPAPLSELELVGMTSPAGSPRARRVHAG